MKTFAVVLALMLAGDAPWQERLETFAGLTCPTLQDANTVANVAQSYNFASTVERKTRCLFVAFNGERTGESEVFGIGDTLYRFLTVSTEGYTVYVLEEVGPGYLA